MKCKTYFDENDWVKVTVPRDVPELQSVRAFRLQPGEY
jgi:hypothetical protein